MIKLATFSNCTLVLFLWLLTIAPHAVEETSVLAPGWEGRTELPDDYPRPPKTDSSLFYIQRNLNTNTIVYDLDIVEGEVRKGHPINAYWLRYGEDGAKKDLSWLQAVLAYGYTSKKIDHGYRIKLKAYNDRYIQLIVKEGKWDAWMTINGTEVTLTNIYVYADESGIFPDVKYVDIYGRDRISGQVIKERIHNK